MDLLKFMGDRYSCRRYLVEDVKEEDILKLLEVVKIVLIVYNE